MTLHNKYKNRSGQYAVSVLPHVSALTADAGSLSTGSRKISHWEVFLASTYRQFAKGVFLLQKPPIEKSKLWISQFTPKCA